MFTSIVNTVAAYSRGFISAIFQTITQIFANPKQIVGMMLFTLAWGHSGLMCIAALIVLQFIYNLCNAWGLTIFTVRYVW